MTTQVRHWLKAAATVAGLVLFFNVVNIYQDWQVLASGSFTQFFPSGSPWAELRDELLIVACEILGVLALLALAQAISHYLFQGRFVIPVGALLLVVAALVAGWFQFNGDMEGSMAVVYGTVDELMIAAAPMAAGAWMLRRRHPQPAPQRAVAGFLGSWESALGTLELESEPGAVFTLHRTGGEPVSGVWTLELGDAPEVVLEVVAPTDLGYGWQSTALAVEHVEGGRVQLRVHDDIVFIRLEPEQDEDLVLEAAHGYVGQVEILEG